MLPLLLPLTIKVMDQFAYLIGVLFPFLLILIVLMILVGVLVVQQRQHSRNPSSLQQSLQRFKVSLILLAIGISVAAVFIQSAIVDLDGFGYPELPEDVQTSAQIMGYLQRYSRGIRTNTYAIIWFFYAFAAWFLTTLYAFAQAVAKAVLSRSHQ